MNRLLVLQHLEREGPGLFRELAEQRGMDVVIYRLDLGDQIPQPLKGDLVLILGGPMGLNDINSKLYPWLLDELDLIKEGLESNRFGIIGVCLGAQLLAYAAGGNVEPLLDKSSNKPLPEIGWHSVFTREDKIRSTLSSYFSLPIRVLHWHGDRILLPNSAELIASSQRCKEQFFKIGKFSYGIQFHLETSNEMVNRWINEDTQFIRLGLGDKAELILKAQQKKYGNQTLEIRLNCINKILNLFKI